MILTHSNVLALSAMQTTLNIMQFCVHVWILMKNAKEAKKEKKNKQQTNNLNKQNKTKQNKNKNKNKITT